MFFEPRCVREYLVFIYTNALSSHYILSETLHRLSKFKIEILENKKKEKI